MYEMGIITKVAVETTKTPPFLSHSQTDTLNTKNNTLSGFFLVTLPTIFGNKTNIKFVPVKRKCEFRIVMFMYSY